MPGSHCAQCAAYEEAVMRRLPGEELAPSTKPCAAYAMSDAMRDWAVAQMTKDVMGQVRGAGLDRMALLKRPSGEQAD